MFVQVIPLGRKMASPGGYMFYIGLNREKHDKSSCLKPQGLEQYYLCVASPNRPLLRLLKLYPWGQTWPRPGGHMFNIGLYIEKKITT